MRDLRIEAFRKPDGQDDGPPADRSRGPPKLFVLPGAFGRGLGACAALRSCRPYADGAPCAEPRARALKVAVPVAVRHPAGPSRRTPPAWPRMEPARLRRPSAGTQAPRHEKKGPLGWVNADLLGGYCSCRRKAIPTWPWQHDDRCGAVNAE